MRLEQLQPGERFQIPAIGRSGKLLALSPGGAHVEYDGIRMKSFDNRWGDRIAFRRASERVTISRASEVLPLEVPGCLD